MKINYELEMQKELEKINENKPKLLLHSCCAPCSCAILEYLLKYFEIDIYYYNPNITEKDEYITRFKEQKWYLNEINYQMELI